MNFRRIKETCFYASDLDAVRYFYADVLGLTIISEVEGKHIFFRVGDSVLLCFNPEDSLHKTSPPSHGSTGKLHWAFEVAEKEYEETKRAIINKGIAIVDEVIWPGGGKSFYFKDPFANVLEILPDRGVWD